MKCGILPAGGKSKRWDGFPKEMLPSYSGSWTLLDRMILLQQRALVDLVYLMSSEDKYDLHRWWIEDKRKWPNVPILLAGSIRDAILGAINANGRADWVFSMPDTVTDIPLFPEELESPLVLGLFDTDEPERFGVIRDGYIVDKKMGDDGKAWGAFMFSADVAQFWLDNKLEDHTAMLNAAIEEFGFTSWDIHVYRDIASYIDYIKFLGEAYGKD